MHWTIPIVAAAIYGGGFGFMFNSISGFINDGDRFEPRWLERPMQCLMSAIWPLLVLFRTLIYLFRACLWVIDRIRKREYHRQERLYQKRMEAHRQQMEAEKKERQRKMEDQRKREAHADRFL